MVFDRFWWIPIVSGGLIEQSLAMIHFIGVWIGYFFV